MNNLNLLNYDTIYHFDYFRIITNVKYVGKVDIFDGEDNVLYRVFEDIFNKNYRIYLTDDEFSKLELF